MEIPKLIIELRKIAIEAGKLELKYFNSGTKVIKKGDGSPVTIADQEAEKIILAGLRKITPDIPIVAEESASDGIIPDISGGKFWLVDPLDGTKEFINNRGEFTVNIALMENFKPVLGVIYAPVFETMYFGYGDTAISCKDGEAEQNISVRKPNNAGLIVVGSRFYKDPKKIEKYLSNKNVKREIPAGSSLKFCMVATGEADLYPRFHPTSEWDTAAGHAILNAAGGKLTNIDGSEFVYGKVKANFLNPGFIAEAA